MNSSSSSSFGYKSNTVQFEFGSRAAYTPWLLPGISRGPANGYATQINKTMEEHITKISETMPIVNSAIEMMTQNILQGGIRIWGSGHKYYNLNTENKEFQRYVQVELFPTFTRIIKEWLLYGFTSIRIAPSIHVPGWPAIVVIPRRHVRQTIEWNEYSQPVYRLYSTGLGGYSDNGENDGEIPFSRMLIFDQPTDQGLMTSPLAVCLTQLTYAQRLTEYYMRAAFAGTHPPLSFSQEDKSSATIAKGGTETAFTSTGLVAGISPTTQGSEATTNMIRDTQERQRQEHIRLAKQQREVAQRQLKEKQQREKAEQKSSILPGHDYLSNSQLAIPDEIRKVESEDAFADTYIAPPNVHLDRPIDFKFPAELTTMLDRFAVDVYRAVGLPPALLNEISDNAASVDATDKHLNSYIAYFQSRATPLFEDLLLLLFGASLIDRVKDDIRREVSDEYQKKQILRGKLDKPHEIIPSSSSSSSPSSGRQRKRDRSSFSSSLIDDKEDKTTKNGKEFTYGVNSEIEPEAEPSVEEQIAVRLQEIQARLTLHFEFAHAPKISLEVLRECFTDGIITGEAFQKYAANIYRFTEEDLSKEGPEEHEFIQKEKELKLEKKYAPAKASDSLSSASSSSSSSTSKPATKKKPRKN